MENIGDFYESSAFIRYFTIAIGALIVAGLMYDIIYGLFLFRKLRNDDKREDSIIIHNNNNIKETKFENKIIENGNGVAGGGGLRNDELNKMRRDIMGIKENIMKINTMAKYKTPWH